MWVGGSSLLTPTLSIETAPSPGGVHYTGQVVQAFMRQGGIPTPMALGFNPYTGNVRFKETSKCYTHTEIHVCICVYICIYIYMYNIYIYIYTHMYMYI